MDPFQFYPTPPSLARKLCTMFQNKMPTRLLEPSAGAGDLARAACEHFANLSILDIDLYEADPSRHGQLEGCGTIIGLDFLESLDLSIYTHILMNPPFRQGIRHVLHAWNKLFTGEIVAVLNASGVREPETRDELRLAKLVAQHGQVEYVTEAFLSPDTQRKTSVEVALVYLKKEKSREFWAGSIMDALGADDLKEDRTKFAEDATPAPQGMALSEGQIPALVRAYHAAWEATKESLIAERRSYQYNQFFEQEMRKLLHEKADNTFYREPEPLHRALGKAYEKLRKSAWMSVLNTSEFRKHLTQKAQQEVLADFATIERMEFSAPNIYGFLQGFAMRQDDINAQMICELFDQIVHANSENCLFYQWKSNAKHQVGMALQRKRFILSGFGLDGWRSNLSWDSEQKLDEVDRIIALLTGQRELEDSLKKLFAQNFPDLCHGARMGNRYFDVRYYPGIGTVHFFPKDQKLIDKINLIVGKHRHWMTENFTAEAEEKTLEKAYKAAEPFSKDVRGKLDQWTLYEALGQTGERQQAGLEKLQKAFDAAEANGGESNFWTQIARIETQPRPTPKPTKESTLEERQQALALALA
jgi:hypothetical protein